MCFLSKCAVVEHSAQPDGTHRHLANVIENLAESWAEPARALHISCIREHLEFAAICMLWRLSSNENRTNQLIEMVDLIYNKMLPKYVFIGMTTLDNLIGRGIINPGVSFWEIVEGSTGNLAC